LDETANFAKHFFFINMAGDLIVVFLQSNSILDA